MVQKQFRRGTSAQVAAFTGAAGEVVVDQGDNRLVVQDGATAGGIPQAKEGEMLVKAGKNTIWVPALSMQPTTTSGAGITVVETTASITTSASLTYPTLAFDGAADEFATFRIAFPNRWNLGTVTYQVYWSSTSALSTDGVAWYLQGSGIANDEVLATTWGTGVNVDDSLTTANDMLITAESGNVTIAGTPADAELTYFRIYRDVDDAGDTSTDDALLIGLKLFWTGDSADDT